jgi:hypothetical protein
MPPHQEARRDKLNDCTANQVAARVTDNRAKCQEPYIQDSSPQALSTRRPPVGAKFHDQSATDHSTDT